MQRSLDTLQSTAFDLLVIGGGILGASVARDAALRGLRVALVERGDWGGGTSSNSSPMQRSLDALQSTAFDLLVIGGGILGASVARDAALRGLRVALVERGDWGGGTSSNSLRIIHGGLRYLQHLDLRRMRESIRERSMWLRIAPHLVEPPPVLVPTPGWGIRGKPALRAALAVNDVVAWDRNRAEEH